MALRADAAEAVLHEELAAKLTVPRRPLVLLPLKEVTRRTSLSRATVYRLIEAGTFPRAVPVSDGRKAWIEGEIDAWIANCVRVRDGTQSDS